MRALAAAALVGVLLLLGVGEARSAPAGSPSLKIQFTVPSTQQGLLNAGRFSGQVTLGSAGVVKLTASARPTDGSASSTRVTKKRLVRFPAGGFKRATLRLSAAGRSVLTGCAPKELSITARLLGGASASGGVHAVATASLTVDPATCGGNPANATQAGAGGSQNLDVLPPPTPSRN